MKFLFRNNLSTRSKYYLDFFPLAFMLIPFLPTPPSSFLQNIFSLSLFHFRKKPFPSTSSGHTFTEGFSAIEQGNDFAISVHNKATSPIFMLFACMWILGVVVMFLLAIHSFFKFRTIKNSALPVQNRTVKRLYQTCCKEINCKKEIPLYSTAFLKSPVTVGVLRPRIYLPIHLISDYNAKDMRFMLLHELQHCRQKDSFFVFLMNLSGILYWFNPFVWYELREMRCDRELSCDSAVLHLLDETDYQAYGNTLLNFAEKISLHPFPYTTGISGSMKQIKQRILNIATFQRKRKQSKSKKFLIHSLIVLLLFTYMPLLTVAAFPQNTSPLPVDIQTIFEIDLSHHFQKTQGSFVLYDSNKNLWNIFDIEQAKKRISPNSTYKIYDALLGLESGIITSENSVITWDGKNYPFDAWEKDQTLHSAMQNSVNWYFQSIDTQLGLQTIRSFLQKIEYGNQKTSSDLDLYWTDLSLKISPMEQVSLLKKFYNNEFHFTPSNIETVKNSILLSSNENGSLYGKTGTGRINGKDVSGWFIGFIETSDNVYYFATNIQGKENITGSKATDITTSILSEFNIWN